MAVGWLNPATNSLNWSWRSVSVWALDENTKVNAHAVKKNDDLAGRWHPSLPILA